MKRMATLPRAICLLACLLPSHPGIKIGHYLAVQLGKHTAAPAAMLQVKKNSDNDCCRATGRASEWTAARCLEPPCICQGVTILCAADMNGPLLGASSLKAPLFPVQLTSPLLVILCPLSPSAQARCRPSSCFLLIARHHHTPTESSNSKKMPLRMSKRRTDQSNP
ncbi:hypothetical protein IWX49DRAFT_81841 [Phyllosticta citricarpa]|uniref:Uncharacterized protein n=2 Tax=Phyllosticta TaxID=121621 RepID=A0ABR1MPW7_9PEZI